mmetsp:Transcript_656/g.2069  ORF Transcript_656/g.2069 Transcript_656/m.2069 type:complete len:217 (+) Transcript_656:622-1272(+)
MRSSLPSTSTRWIRCSTACSRFRCTRRRSVFAAICSTARSVSLRRLVSWAIFSVSTWIRRSSIWFARYGAMDVVCTSCWDVAACFALSVSSSFSRRSPARSGCQSSQIHRQYSKCSIGRRFLCSSRQAKARRSCFSLPLCVVSIWTAPWCLSFSLRRNSTSFRSANSMESRSASRSRRTRSSFSSLMTAIMPSKAQKRFSFLFWMRTLSRSCCRPL